jgi:hypothetical protein
MLKINAIRLEINTTGGLFGAELSFVNGLNIIRGNNSTGKSSMFQAILYGLGIEELLGSKNANTMQYVLRDHVNYDNQEFDVLQSFVFLEFTNGEKTVTSKRSVVCQGRCPQFVELIEGAYLSQGGDYNIRPMWVHDAGGATNETYGYHLFLQEFLGWELPEVTNSRGETTRLYIQQIAPAFILEQKTGWSHFLATMPYYNLRNAEGKSIEFLLKLDVAENGKLKRHINIQKQLLTQKWQSLFEQVKSLAQKGATTLNGLTPTPSIINDIKSISLSVIKEEETLSIVDFVEQLRQDYKEMENTTLLNVGQTNDLNEQRLNYFINEYNKISLQIDVLIPDIALDKGQLRRYKEQLIGISEDLRKNKDLLKINKLGAEIEMPTAINICPLCKNTIDDNSLLPEELKETPMQLEDNITYLDAQKKMIEVYIEGQRKHIQDKELHLQAMQNKSVELKQNIRNLKRELIADERLPSEIEIERRLNLRNKIDFYLRLIDDFNSYKNDVLALSEEWKELINREKNLPLDFYSLEDRKKISDLENFFLNLLNQFDYSSQSGERIRISMEKYLPMVEAKINDEKIKQYDIKYDSSGSDFVRAIWAYTCALKKVSDLHVTNHPRLLMMDEPQQQSVSIDDFKTLLTELSKYKNAQVLVFASFNNSDEDYENSTKGLEFSLNKIEGKIVKQL